MLSTYDGEEAFIPSMIDTDRAGLPLLGFVLGIGISVALWGLVGSIVWLVVT